LSTSVHIFGPTWYQTQIPVHETRLRDTIHAAIDTLTNQGRPVTSPSAIAQLAFGFWLTLLARRFDTILWRPAIRNAFPHKTPLIRQDVYNAIDRVKNLRNRIAHHEPIYTRNLPDDLTHLVDAASWICPDTAQWLDHCADRFRTVLANQPQAPRAMTSFSDNFDLIDWTK